MLIICNGGPKSGSTWVTNIVKNIELVNPIKKEYRNPRWFNPSFIDHNRFELFISSTNICYENFYCKQHWSGEDWHQKLLCKKNIKVLNTVRDPKDVLCSRYFADIRKHQTTAINIENYYWEDDGRNKLIKWFDYQFFWHNPENIYQPFVTMYEELLLKPHEKISKLLSFLEIDYRSEDVERIEEETRFYNQPIRGDGTFYRKGIAGDWMNHLNKNIVDDINLLITEKNFINAFPAYSSYLNP